MKPKFSVVMPTFNRPALLKRALRSISKQTFSDYEVIVVDDHSEMPVSIPDDIGIENIRLIRHQVNSGAASAYNSGIATASGEFISILDDDDEYHPDFLAITARALHDHPEAEWCWSSIRVIDYGSERSLAQAVDSIYPSHYESDDDLYFDAVRIGNGFGFTVRSSCYARVGRYDETFKIAEDAEFVYRLLAMGARPVVIPDQLVTVHNHSAERLTSKTNNAGRLNDCIRIYNRHHDFIKRWPRIDRHLSMIIKRLEESVSFQAQ